VTPRTRLLRLALWAAAANLTLVVLAVGLAASTGTTEAARRFLALCGLG